MSRLAALTRFDLGVRWWLKHFRAGAEVLQPCHLAPVIFSLAPGWRSLYGRLTGPKLHPRGVDPGFHAKNGH